MDNFSHQAFLDRLDDTFHLHSEGSEPVDLTLAQVGDLKTTKRQEVFSIVFRAPSDRVLPQHIYCLEHPTMGAFDLFLVPIEKNKEGVFYEAVFNRLIEA